MTCYRLVVTKVGIGRWLAIDSESTNDLEGLGYRVKDLNKTYPDMVFTFRPTNEITEMAPVEMLPRKVKQ